MRITSNTVGNYNPYGVNNNKHVSESVNNQTKEDGIKISGEEKDFFKKMYPESKTEITDYHYYQKSGKLSGVSVGSLFDRRG